MSAKRYWCTGLMLFSCYATSSLFALPACQYDVTKDKFTVVSEYKTSAIKGWYTDTFSTPVTTVNGVIYYVYVTPALKARVGKIVNGVVSEYDLDTAWTVTNDGHDEFSIAVDKDGYIHVMGDMHNKSFRYWRSNKPLDLTSFTRHFGEIQGDNFTYNMFRTDNNGELYMVARARVLKSYNAIGGRGAGVYKYDSVTKQWIALGDIPVYPNAVQKIVGWENSAESGGNYQMFKPDLRFDKNNRMHFTVALNNDNATNGRNYAIYGYSDDNGKTFHRASTALITPMPMRVDAGSSQADVVDGYKNANMGEHSGILLNGNNGVGVYFSIDNGTWYRNYANNAWSGRQSIIPGVICTRCMTLSDQDNDVMTVINGSKWYRFADFGKTPVATSVGATILRWDLRALHDKHIYRGVDWNASTGVWQIIRVDVSNPTKCY